MVALVTQNTPNAPKGYRLPGFGASKYVVFNGSAIAGGVQRGILGATQIYNVGSVPADLSTFILKAPNGGQFLFQFVYNASAQTQGIKIPLPASGSSTAAQVQTAIQGVLGKLRGVDFSGASFSFPWAYRNNTSAQFQIDWTVGGSPATAGGTQVTITAGPGTSPVTVSTPLIPGRVGKLSVVLPQR